MVTQPEEGVQRYRVPTRDAAVLVRLTREERRRLHAYARQHDLFPGQAARQIINAAIRDDDEGAAA